MPDPFAGHVAPDPAAGPEIPPDQAPPEQFAVTRSPAGPRPTMGRIVHYVLTERDSLKLAGSLAPGETVPAIVSRDEADLLTLCAFPVGFPLAVYAEGPGDLPGQWSWPPQIEG